MPKRALKQTRDCDPSKTNCAFRLNFESSFLQKTVQRCVTKRQEPCWKALESGCPCVIGDKRSQALIQVDVMTFFSFLGYVKTVVFKCLLSVILMSNSILG